MRKIVRINISKVVKDIIVENGKLKFVNRDGLNTFETRLYHQDMGFEPIITKDYIKTQIDEVFDKYESYIRELENKIETLEGKNGKLYTVEDIVKHLESIGNKG